MVNHHQWMDFLTSPLNPCSLETIPEPIELLNGKLVWPLMLSCYQLEEIDTHEATVKNELNDAGQTNTKETKKYGQHRCGSMDLYFVQVPDIANSYLSQMPLQFGQPCDILDTSTTTTVKTTMSGVLDGKWSRMPLLSFHDPRFDCLGTDCSVHQYAFATAHASGEIQIHALTVPTCPHKARKNLPLLLESDPLYLVDLVGQSEPPEIPVNGIAPLCLSLNWDRTWESSSQSTESAEPFPRSDTTRIVSTYSNGRVSIHDVVQLSSTNGHSIQLIERDSWHAHSMFTAPAEVWSACFTMDTCSSGSANTDIPSNSIISCGDEGSFKLWDLRATTRPIQVCRPFDAGVTCVSPHPRLPQLIACGSYDETICVYDVRYLSSSQRPWCRTPPLGGGIWRIKWHPCTDHRLLVAAMHGGCHVIDLPGLVTTPTLKEPLAAETMFVLDSHNKATQADDVVIIPQVTKSFTAHESMAYGADWLVCRHPTHKQSYFEAAASCSFYDRAVYLWDSVY